MGREALPKHLAEADARRFVGRLLADALRHANVLAKDAAARMGYADQSTLSDWMSGQHVPAFFAKFLADERLRRGFIVALAELPGDDVHAKTVIEIEGAA